MIKTKDYANHAHIMGLIERANPVQRAQRAQQMQAGIDNALRGLGFIRQPPPLASVTPINNKDKTDK